MTSYPKGGGPLTGVEEERVTCALGVKDGVDDAVFTPAAKNPLSE